MCEVFDRTSVNSTLTWWSIKLLVCRIFLGTNFSWSKTRDHVLMFQNTWNCPRIKDASSKKWKIQSINKLSTIPRGQLVVFSLPHMSLSYLHYCTIARQYIAKQLRYSSMKVVQCLFSTANILYFYYCTIVI